MNALVYVMAFIVENYKVDQDNFEVFLLGHFIKHKPLISEECNNVHDELGVSFYVKQLCCSAYC